MSKHVESRECLPSLNVERLCGPYRTDHVQQAAATATFWQALLVALANSTSRESLRQQSILRSSSNSLSVVPGNANLQSQPEQSHHHSEPSCSPGGPSPSRLCLLQLPSFRRSYDACTQKLPQRTYRNPHPSSRTLKPSSPSLAAKCQSTPLQLRELGVEPARNRRYLLHWRNKFRHGSFGIGGDLTHVQDGVGELKIVEVPAASGTATLTSSPGMRKIVVNVPAGQDAPSQSLDKIKPVQGTKVVRSNLIGGSYVEAIKERPGTAKIVAKEGLWEVKRGHKIDGGERRKAEVRYKRRVEERKTTRG
jgi:hypothetical protein